MESLRLNRAALRRSARERGPVPGPQSPDQVSLEGSRAAADAEAARDALAAVRSLNEDERRSAQSVVCVRSDVGAALPVAAAREDGHGDGDSGRCEAHRHRQRNGNPSDRLTRMRAASRD
jgi:hypothetical protein